LARDYHPDRTHDDGKVMAALNDAHERLRSLVGQNRYAATPGERTP
jgi:hypothetical protein